MSLILGDIDSPEDVKDAFASIQNQFAKADGNGRWVNYTAKAEDFSVAGASNTWVVPGLPDALGRYVTYALVGDTMTVNLYVPVSNLTITTATTALLVRIPGGYKAGGPPVTATTPGRVYHGAALVTNGGANVTSRCLVNAGSLFITIEKNTGAAFTTDTALFVQGSIQFQAVPL